MKRDEICEYFQNNTFLLADLSKMKKKEFAVAVVILEGEFVVLLYHIGTERIGYYNPTTTLFCSSKDEGQKYSIEGISDYFAIMFGMNQQYNRTTYKINEFDDSSNDIEAYSPWSVEEFRNSNSPFLCGSHMMTIKLVLSFATSVSCVQSVLNDINSELVLWPSKICNVTMVLTRSGLRCQ